MQEAFSSLIRATAHWRAEIISVCFFGQSLNNIGQIWRFPLFWSVTVLREDLCIRSPPATAILIALIHKYWITETMYIFILGDCCICMLSHSSWNPPRFSISLICLFVCLFLCCMTVAMILKLTSWVPVLAQWCLGEQKLKSWCMSIVAHDDEKSFCGKPPPWLTQQNSLPLLLRGSFPGLQWGSRFITFPRQSFAGARIQCTLLILPL